MNIAVLKEGRDNSDNWSRSGSIPWPWSRSMSSSMTCLKSRSSPRTWSRSRSKLSSRSNSRSLSRASSRVNAWLIAGSGLRACARACALSGWTIPKNHNRRKTMYQIDCKKAALGAKAVYTNNIDLGTTEFSLTVEDGINCIDIAGTNEKSDWRKNLNMMSKEGVKKTSFQAAIEIAKYLRGGTIDLSMPIIVRGHSKGGAAAIAYHKTIKKHFPYLKSHACVAFAPARCLRYWVNRRMDNMVLFTDPDDYVSELLGRINFGLPKCEHHYEAPDNHWGFSVNDHPIDHWVHYTDKLDLFIDFEKG